MKTRILQQCRCVDRARLFGLLKKSGRHQQPLLDAIEASVEQVQLRSSNRPSVKLNAALPFIEHRDELAEAITKHQVVIVCGETGSGKTTQLPQLCIDLGLADKGIIGHTQPRRIAAQSVSQRIAEELNTVVGEKVGYKIRFQDRSNSSAYLKLMTDGILLAETQTDRWLSQYSTLIIDEAHERSLNIDLLLGYIKQLLPKRPDLKLIVTSATIDPARFASYFNNAPIINISGRTYPVEIRYRPASDNDRDQLNLLCDAVDELDAVGREDILVFFPGERQIRDAAQRLSKQFSRDYDVLPLFARLSPGEQRKIFQKHQKRRIVLATNIAETSLTIEGIRYVIDTGLARLSRYSWRAGIQRLPIEKISQASANQRSGRCGRVAPGICIRLYDQDDFESRSAFTEAEILRSNLASVILQMDDLKLGSIHQFDFVESPDSRLINDGYRLLFEIGATDKSDQITKHGHQIAKLPIDPRLAHMLIRARALNCLDEILIIVSALSVQDPRSASAENRQAANEKYKAWTDEGSDFIFWINLWRGIHPQQKQLSRNQYSNWCQKHFLSYLRLREWQDIYQQLKQQVTQLQFRFNTAAADSETIHRCLFGGIPSHIASFDKDARFQSTRARQVMIFPSSSLAKQTPKWLMAFSFIETNRLYALSVAGFKPQWAMQDAQHLHQYDYYEPHWQPKQGRVAAFRNTRIYGLLIEGGKRVNFAAIDPKQSRQIFIQSALVDGDYRTNIDVVKANRKLIVHFQEQEDKYRRRDILVSDRLLYDFYDGRLPAQAVDAPSFEAWLKKCSEAQINALRFLNSDIADDSIDQQKRGGFPETIDLQGQPINLEYRFEPGHEFDGVTADIPLVLLNRCSDTDFERLVPGLLKEKIEALIRSLPRKTRKNFIPATEFASACFERLQPKDRLLDSMQQSLRAMTSVEVEPSLWQPDSLETHLKMHFQLSDGKKVIAQSHSLEALQAQFAVKARDQFDQQIQQNTAITREGLTDWDFDHLPDTVQIDASSKGILAYPALVDYENSVAIELFETAIDANFYHPSGVARLILLQLGDSIKYLRKQLPDIDKTALMYSAMGSRAELLADLFMVAVFDCFLSDPLPKTNPEFKQCVDNNRADFVSAANRLAELCHQLLTLRQTLRLALEDSHLPEDHRRDLYTQLDGLIYAGFLRDIPPAQLKRIPAYLQGMLKRVQNNKAVTPRIQTQLETIQSYQKFCWDGYEQTNHDYEKLDELRWMIEEFRIACFAQPMKTRIPVSEKKIEKVIAGIKSA